MFFYHLKHKPKREVPYLEVANLVRRKGLAERNHHFFHIALMGMGSNVRALVRTQLNVGDQQIRDDWLHWLQGWSGRGKMESDIWRSSDELTCLPMGVKKRMPLCLRQELHWEPKRGIAESGRQVVWPPERMERKRKSSVFISKTVIIGTIDLFLSCVVINDHIGLFKFVYVWLSLSGFHWLKSN